MKSRNHKRLVSLLTAEANSALVGVCVQKLSSKEIHGRSNLPLFEVSVEDSAGESFPTDPDALQDPITA